VTQYILLKCSKADKVICLLFDYLTQLSISKRIVIIGVFIYTMIRNKLMFIDISVSSKILTDTDFQNSVTFNTEFETHWSFNHCSCEHIANTFTFKFHKFPKFYTYTLLLIYTRNTLLFLLRPTNPVNNVLISFTLYRGYYAQTSVTRKKLGGNDIFCILQ